MLDHAHHHLAATADTPAVLVLARTQRAVTAISVAGSLLTAHCVPAPEHPRYLLVSPEPGPRSPGPV